MTDMAITTVGETGVVVSHLARNLQVVHLDMEAIKAFMANEMVEGQDYGKIPGCGDKPALLKGGAEKIDLLFKVHPHYTIQHCVENPDTGLAYYRILCELVSNENGQVIGEGIGSCSSYTDKYLKYVPKFQVPAGLDIATLPTKGGKVSEFDFAIEKKETTGQYGKPVEYWAMWEKAIADGTAVKVDRKSKAGKSLVAYEMDGTLYQLPPGSYLMDKWNTVLKMAQKSAHVAAALSLGCLGAILTQDLEDYVVEGTWTGVPVKPQVSEEEARKGFLGYAYAIGYKTADGQVDAARLINVLKPLGLYPYQPEKDEFARQVIQAAIMANNNGGQSVAA